MPTSQNFGSNFFKVCPSLWEVHTCCVRFHARLFGIQNSVVSFMRALNSINSWNNICHVFSFPNASVYVIESGKQTKLACIYEEKISNLGRASGDLG
jgi:hypothetical protein